MLLVLIVALAGCRSIAPLPAVNLSEPGWKLREGQVVWRSKKGAPEIAGDILVALNPDGRSFVQFTKTPLPFFVAQTTSNSWQFEVVPRHKTYSYRGRPPAWLLWPNLPACLRGAPPKKCDCVVNDDGKFHFENPSNGEMIDGYLNP